MSSTTRAGSSTSPPSAAARQGLGAGLAGLRSRYPLAFFVGRRLVALIVLGIGITLVAFVLTQLVPGDPAEANLGQRAGSDPVAVRAFRAHYGLDRPLPVQYGLYLLHLTQGDLGESQQSHRSVRADLAEYIPATAELAITSMLLAGVSGIALGVLAAIRRNRLTDQLLRVVSLGGISMPTFWLALVGLYLFCFELSLLPGGGRLDPGVPAPPQLTGLYTVDAVLAGQPDVALNALHHLVLPALVLAAYNIGL